MSTGPAVLSGSANAMIGCLAPTLRLRLPLTQSHIHLCRP